MCPHRNRTTPPRNATADGVESVVESLWSKLPNDGALLRCILHGHQVELSKTDATLCKLIVKDPEGRSLIVNDRCTRSDVRKACGMIGQAHAKNGGGDRKRRRKSDLRLSGCMISQCSSATWSMLRDLNAAIEKRSNRKNLQWFIGELHNVDPNDDLLQAVERLIPMLKGRCDDCERERALLMSARTTLEQALRRSEAVLAELAELSDDEEEHEEGGGQDAHHSKGEDSEGEHA